jgi:hypothetical protein
MFHFFMDIVMPARIRVSGLCCTGHIAGTGENGTRGNAGTDVLLSFGI